MSFLNTISESLVLPMGDLLTGRSIRKQLDFLMQSQWWNEEQLKNFQEDRLKVLIRHCVNTVPYYRDLFKDLKLNVDDIQTIEDLRKLPVINKTIIKEIGREYFISEKVSKDKMIKNSSSGSTGQPFEYFTTKEAESFAKACNLRGWYWMGYRIGDKFVKVINSKRQKTKFFQDIFSRNLCIYAMDISVDNINEVVTRINKYQPKIIRSYPDPIINLMQLAKSKNLNFVKPTAVTTTGNILYPAIRNEIEETFKTNVFDAYACEGGANVFECTTHKCYHSSMEYAITEIIDNYDIPAKKGRVVTTDLWNMAMPFLRYDTQDIMELSTEKCSCGRHLLPVKQIWGRNIDMLINAKGENIMPLTISKMMKEIEGIDQYQVIQNSINDIEVLVKANYQKHDTLRQGVVKLFTGLFGSDIKLQIKVVSEIPLSSSGKRRYIMRNNF